MERYSEYLLSVLGIEKIKYLNYDEQGYYFNGIDRGNILKIKVIGTRIFINNTSLDIKVEDPFEFNNRFNRLK